MNKPRILTLMASAVFAFVLPHAAHAQALNILNPSLQIQVKKKVSKQKSVSNKAKFSPGSQESTKERSARLQRECKGEVNAGACAGYTR